MIEHLCNSDNKIIEEFVREKYWGLETLINLYDCDIDLMVNEDHIRKFIVDLCDFIDMTRHGEPFVERFGHDNLYGFSFAQMITTSCITGHLAEDSKTVYLDIFSCKEFAPEKTAEFCREYFKGSRYEFKAVVRN